MIRDRYIVFFAGMSSLGSKKDLVRKNKGIRERKYYFKFLILNVKQESCFETFWQKKGVKSLRSHEYIKKTSNNSVGVWEKLLTSGAVCSRQHSTSWTWEKSKINLYICQWKETQTYSKLTILKSARENLLLFVSWR